MKTLTTITTFLIFTFFFGCSTGQTKNGLTTDIQQNKVMDNFEYNFKSANHKAQILMTDEFYWCPIEETAPFGSDDGSDAAYGFRQWRFANNTASPLNYLKELIANWQYPFFDYNEMDTTKIRDYITRKEPLNEATIQERIQTLKSINAKSPDSAIKLDDAQLREIITSSAGMGGTYLLGQDNAIIGTAFAQFVLEGHIDNDIQNVAIIAIKRQLLPVLINRYDEDYRSKRKKQLTKMLDVLYKANS